jgi:hypothetical protein
VGDGLQVLLTRDDSLRDFDRVVRRLKIVEELLGGRPNPVLGMRYQGTFHQIGEDWAEQSKFVEYLLLDPKGCRK